MSDKYKAWAEEIVDKFLGGKKYEVLDRTPEDPYCVPPMSYRELVLAIDVDEGQIYLDIEYKISGDNAVTARRFHGLVYTVRFGWSRNRVIKLTRQPLVRVVSEMLPFAERVLDGSEVMWNGRNRVGRYDEDADEAMDELIEIAKKNFFGAEKKKAEEVY